MVNRLSFFEYYFSHKLILMINMGFKKLNAIDIDFI